jgi:hypothetical protein
MGITVWFATKYVISHACGDAPHSVASAQGLEFEPLCSPSQNGESIAWSGQRPLKSIPVFARKLF